MKKANILIVDDVEINREMLATILESEYTVHQASNGREAIEMLEDKQCNYRLVILDIMMPVLDGYGVLEYMEKKDILRNIPVIIISGNSSEISVLRAYEYGAVDFFSKPFNSKIIKKRVRDLLDLYDRDCKDMLTGGYSRIGFLREVEEILSTAGDENDYAIMYFDIKNFKAVNELYGLEGGDIILKVFYQNLLESPWKPILVSRIEADHFACFVESNKIELDELNQRMDEEWKLYGKTIHLFARCGIYHIEDKSLSVSGMIDRARLAKQLIGEGSTKLYAVFDDEMRMHYVDQAEVLSEFAEGITNGEFKVYYQPVVEAGTGNLVSAEALVRWIHPERGFISPAAFIPALEKNGLISKLDWYMIQSVYDFIEDRYQKGLSVVPVSVNLSWTDFYDEEVMNHILEKLKHVPFPRDLIRCEVTETSFASQEQNCCSILAELRDNGVKILLDDFGSGYSSFGMLQSYSFDILKIDMSFIRQIEENAKVRNIIRTIIDMCHQIGIKVIAEGAESKEQAVFLKNNECDYIQGYYYSKPLAEKEFVEYVEKYGSEGRIAEPRLTEEGGLRSYFKEGLNYISDEARQVVALESHQISRVLSMNHAVGVVSGIVDDEFSIGFISDIGLDIIGYTMNELIERTKGSYLKLIAPEDREAFISNVEDERRSYSIVTADGKLVAIEEKRIIENARDHRRQWIIAIRKMDMK